tara:strand:- start:4763 stop:5119 length:357 start_codon:yes stop_codon:yes gene_type:complete
MKDLVENFKHFLTEEKSVYVAELLIKAEPGTRLYGRVFEAIRGIEGVTVIRSTETIKKDDKDNKIMNLSVRFYVNPANSIPYLEKLKNTIRNLKDDDGDRILSVIIRKLPEKVDDIFR